MSIQKGDMFLCKSTNNFLKRGKCYEIDEVIISTEGHFLVDVSDGEGSGMVLVIKLLDVPDDYDYVHKRKNTYFYNTFYTKKEERKLKLDSLNGNN